MSYTISKSYVITTAQAGCWDAGYWTRHHALEDAQDCVKSLGAGGTLYEVRVKTDKDGNRTEVWKRLDS